MYLKCRYLPRLFMKLTVLIFRETSFISKVFPLLCPRPRYLYPIENLYQPAYFVTAAVLT